MNNSDRPAMPQPLASNGVDLFDTSEYAPSNAGLTKREHFAGLAMQAYISGNAAWSGGDSYVSVSHVEAATEAVHYADALLAELDK